MYVDIQYTSLLAYTHLEGSGRCLHYIVARPPIGDRKVLLHPLALQSLIGVEPLLGVKFDKVLDEFLRLTRDVIPAGTLKVIRAPHYLIDNMAALPTRERHLRAEKHVSDDAYAPEVGLTRVHSLKDLRGHGVYSPDSVD